MTTAAALAAASAATITPTRPLVSINPSESYIIRLNNTECSSTKTNIKFRQELNLHKKSRPYPLDYGRQHTKEKRTYQAPVTALGSKITVSAIAKHMPQYWKRNLLCYIATSYGQKIALELSCVKHLCRTSIRCDVNKKRQVPDKQTLAATKEYMHYSYERTSGPVRCPFTRVLQE